MTEKSGKKEGFEVEIRKEIITSRQNQSVSALVKLTDRKERNATGTFRFDGIKLTGEALGSGVEISELFLRESTAERILNLLRTRFPKTADKLIGTVTILSDALFNRISEEKSPEGVICRAKYIDKLQKIDTIYNEMDFLRMGTERVVLLESVRDPANLGAIIRSAAALGTDRLIISSDCADIYHPKTVRASMGTLFRQKIDRTDLLVDAIRGLRAQGRRVFAAALDRTALRLGEFEILPGDCPVIGNEGHGLSEEIISCCSHRVYIPMSECTESFNAGVAAAILMWEFAKAPRPGRSSNAGSPIETGEETE